MKEPLTMNYHGPEWESLKRWLLQTKERKTDLLVQASSWDDSLKLRGALALISEILAEEKAALSR